MLLIVCDHGYLRSCDLTNVHYYYNNNHTSNNSTNNVRNWTELEAQAVTRCTEIADSKVQTDCMKM